LGNKIMILEWFMRLPMIWSQNIGRCLLTNWPFDYY
jgi:hypothetical protein